MSISTINEDYMSIGQIRYFQATRCENDVKLQEFNKGKIKAKELVTFDCGLMDLEEIAETNINIADNCKQLLAIIIRPEIQPDYRLEQEQQFQFCGYDLVDITPCVSVITNHGAVFSVIDYAALNEYGLISSYKEAVRTQLDLCEKYPEDSHTYCEIVEIWRRIVN